MSSRSVRIRLARLRWHFWSWLDDRAVSLSRWTFHRQSDGYLRLAELVLPDARRDDIAAGEALADSQHLLRKLRGE